MRITPALKVSHGRFGSSARIGRVGAGGKTRSRWFCFCWGKHALPGMAKSCVPAKGVPLKPSKKVGAQGKRWTQMDEGKQIWAMKRDPPFLFSPWNHLSSRNGCGCLSLRPMGLKHTRNTRSIPDPVDFEEKPPQQEAPSQASRCSPFNIIKGKLTSNWPAVFNPCPLKRPCRLTGAPRTKKGRNSRPWARLALTWRKHAVGAYGRWHIPHPATGHHLDDVSSE